MEQHLKADPMSVQQLFLHRQVQFCIPRFQRSYCWNEENIDILWGDIDALLVDSTVEAKFLGAIIVKDLRALVSTAPPAFDVIDGQQRLITIFLLLCVVAANCSSTSEKIKNIDAEQDDARDELAAALAERARNIGKGLLIISGSDERRPKIEPSLEDMAEFNWALEYLGFLDADAPRTYDLAPDAKIAGPLETAVELIDERLTQRLREAGEHAEATARVIEQANYLLRLADEVLGNLEVIEVKLGSRYDPNEVFDRLNLQGQELTVLDLIRNEIFRVFGDDSDAAIDFYKNRWRKFEKKFATPFEHLYSETDNKRYNDKLRAHKKNFWFPYALMVDPNCTSSDKRVFKTLQTHWAGMGEQGSALASRILDDLEVFLPVYNAIAAGEKPSGQSVDSKVWELVERMHRYEIQSGTYVYLFNLVNYAFNEATDDELPDIVRCLQLVESYIIRKACMKDDGSVKNVFNSIWSLVKTDPELLVYQLHDNSRPFYEDEQVIESLTTEGFNFYGLKGRAKFILLEKEHQHPGDKISWGNSNMDHIMPQKLSPAWGHIADEEHESFRNALGNLVILTPRSNSSKGHISWDETRALYREQSHAHEPKTICEYPIWDGETIASRSRLIAEWVVKHWPKPERPTTTLNRALTKKLDELANGVAPRLDALDLDYVLFNFTKTGSNKHNITANKAISDFLCRKAQHDFSSQQKGDGAKATVPVKYFLPSGEMEAASMSLYRTKTKGENRLWMKGLDAYAGQWSLIALCFVREELLALNCSHAPTLDAFYDFHKDL